MGEARLEIGTGGEIEFPTELCCNCASPDRVDPVDSELKLTRYFGMGGSEYAFTWPLPYCPECQVTASRNPLNRLHVVLVVGVWTTALFLAATIGQMALGRNLLEGNDFWIALVVSTVLVAGFYAARRPQGQQTSYYQPVRIRKLRQKFTSGEVTGIVLGFTNRLYMRRFQEQNARSLAR